MQIWKQLRHQRLLVPCSVKADSQFPELVCGLSLIPGKGQGNSRNQQDTVVKIPHRRSLVARELGSSFSSVENCPQELGDDKAKKSSVFWKNNSPAQIPVGHQDFMGSNQAKKQVKNHLELPP